MSLRLFSWLTLPVITVWRAGPTANIRDWDCALLTGGALQQCSADAPSANREAGKKVWATRALASFFHMQMLHCDNKHLTRSMTELSCLFNQRHWTLSSQPFVPFGFGVTFIFSSKISSPSLPLFISICLSFHFFIYFFTFTLSSLPSMPLISPPSHHSAVFTLIHYHFFPSIGFSGAKFSEQALAGAPLGMRKWQKAAFYLPLWPLPCHLLNHVANRQHCLPACPRLDNGEPHSYLIQWSV